jgi:hypothetical protein
MSLYEMTIETSDEDLAEKFTKMYKTHEQVPFMGWPWAVRGVTIRHGEGLHTIHLVRRKPLELLRPAG